MIHVLEWEKNDGNNENNADSDDDSVNISNQYE